ncbi:MAG TPA: hypothetical protein VFA26_03765 [Gemmataceae bacterium]|nr:hypothetical protein [Gemmataceae bacterium]
MPRHIRFVALVVALLLPCAARAEVKIAMANRVKNKPPGRCGWCAVETLARHHGLKALYDLTECSACRCCPSDLEAALAKAGIRYRVQKPGNTDPAILRYAIRKDLGAAVGFRELEPGAGGHIVTLVDFTDEGVKVIDPNDSDRRTRTMTVERFLYWWDGFALVLETKSARPARR